MPIHSFPTTKTRLIAGRSLASFCVAIVAAFLLFTGSAYGKTHTSTPAKKSASVNLAVDIERIAPKEAVCVGKVEVGNGDLTYQVSAEKGEGLFVALYRSNDVKSYDQKGVAWKQYAGGGKSKSINVTLDDTRPGSYYLYVGSTGSALSGVEGKIYTGDYQKPAKPSAKAISAMEKFAAYSGFGLSYDAEHDALIYKGQRVKVFIAYQHENKRAFEVCWHDEDADTELYLQAVKDNRGKVTGLRKLDREDESLQSILSANR